MYQLNRGLIKADGCVINRGSADLKQLALARQAQIGVLFADHVTAVTGAHRFSPCDKNHFAPQAEQSWREAL
jgi:hypothetical protein